MRKDSFVMLATLCEQFQAHGISAVASNQFPDNEQEAAALYLTLPEGRGRFKVLVLDITQNLTNLLTRWPAWEGWIILPPREHLRNALGAQLKGGSKTDWTDNKGIVAVRVGEQTYFLIVRLVERE